VEVRLAGQNIDRDLLLEIRAALRLAARIPGGLSPEGDAARAEAERLLAADNWTPETLSAAYARISRDPRPVHELRAAARREVDAARRSNSKIIFGLGHASVAEHAVFNLDILGISRLCVEEIEKMRLCSYTEKSQRYILLDEDFVVPEEARAAGIEADFRKLLREQNEFYRNAYETLRPWILGRHAAGAGSQSETRRLEGLAKEDARYGLSMATTVQLGETINARNLEALIARSAAHPLAELKSFARLLRQAVQDVAPSVVKHTEPSEHLRRTPEALREVAAGTGGDGTAGGDVVLLDCPEDAEARVVGAILHTYGARDARACRRRAQELGPEGRLGLIRTALERLSPHDSVLREFEHASLCFELVVSAACFAQLKRHRMATLTAQEYDPALGVTMPPSFESTGLAEPFEKLRASTESLHDRLRAAAGPRVAPYVLLNAHRRRVLWRVSARELYHVARLRCDAHAQWDIRRMCDAAISLARERIPSLLLLACGKDRFEEVRRSVFPESA